MLTITKIFRFEMAHALYGYNGPCQHIHGHTYELHVSVTASSPEQGYIEAPGYMVDFKELKQIVTAAILTQLDHKLCLSQAYMEANGVVVKTANLLLFEAEPSVENLLLYIRHRLQQQLAPAIRLYALKLYETKDSYATWTDH